MDAIRSVLSYSLRYPGDIVEVGVGPGVSANRILDFAGGRWCWFYDTFAGFPVETRDGGPPGVAEYLGGCATEELAQKLEAREGRVIRGRFPDSYCGPDATCFVHLDCDTYFGTSAGLRLFWPGLAVGGSVLVHDYFGSPGQTWPGVRAAVDEFVVKMGDAVTMEYLSDELYVRLVKRA